MGAEIQSSHLSLEEQAPSYNFHEDTSFFIVPCNSSIATAQSGYHWIPFYNLHKRVLGARGGHLGGREKTKETGMAVSLHLLPLSLLSYFSFLLSPRMREY